MDKITHSLQWFKKVIIDIFITRLKSSIICVGLKELYSKPIFASEGQNREDIHKINLLGNTRHLKSHTDLENHCQLPTKEY